MLNKIPKSKLHNPPIPIQTMRCGNTSCKAQGCALVKMNITKMLIAKPLPRSPMFLKMPVRKPTINIQQMLSEKTVPEILPKNPKLMANTVATKRTFMRCVKFPLSSIHPIASAVSVINAASASCCVYTPQTKGTQAAMPIRKPQLKSGSKRSLSRSLSKVWSERKATGFFKEDRFFMITKLGFNHGVLMALSRGGIHFFDSKFLGTN